MNNQITYGDIMRVTSLGRDMLAHVLKKDEFKFNTETSNAFTELNAVRVEIQEYGLVSALENVADIVNNPLKPEDITALSFGSYMPLTDVKNLISKFNNAGEFDNFEQKNLQDLPSPPTVIIESFDRVIAARDR